jgi:hypothetical protein
LVVKLSSATRLSLLAGQPKPIRALLLTQVCGTVVGRLSGVISRRSSWPAWPPAHVVACYSNIRLGVR